jgi:histidinol-phosphatase (PHP family)
MLSVYSEQCHFPTSVLVIELEKRAIFMNDNPKFAPAPVNTTALPRRRMDYHLHTAVTIDCKMSEIDACERAVALGVDEIAFTNHSMLTEPEYTISVSDMIAHWRQVQVCQQRYSHLTIRLGLELDYYPERENEIRAVIQRYEDAIDRPFDLILGAVHHLNGVFFSEQSHAVKLYDGADIVRLYRDYFQLASRAAQSGLYDVIAHPDLVKKYTGQLSPPVSFQRYRQAALAFVDALLNSGVGIEVNTKGLTLGVAEIYPSDDLLRLYLDQAKARGTEAIVTIGSDAHRVADVAARIPDGVAALRRTGATAITFFARRKRNPLLL